jgi:hypothetical protein
MPAVNPASNPLLRPLPLQTMREAAEQLPGRVPQPSSPNKRRRGGPVRPAGWQPWQHDPLVWARGGRMAKELHQEALGCCKVRYRQPVRQRCLPPPKHVCLPICLLVPLSCISVAHMCLLLLLPLPLPLPQSIGPAEST